MTKGPTMGEGSARRRQLLDIAAVVFAEKGIANTTVRDIADRAGILSGSLYHHFTSKDQMVGEVLERGLCESYQRDAVIIAEAATPTAALHQLIVELIQWVADEPHVARILSNDQQYLNDAEDLVGADRERKLIRRLWIELVESGQRSGDFTESVVPEVCVRAIFDGALGAVRWLPPVGDRDPAEVGGELARFYGAGLVGAPLPAEGPDAVD